MQQAFGASASCLWWTPIGGPFPNTADHLMRGVAIDRECGGGRGAFEAISHQIGYACRNANVVHGLLAVTEFQSYERRPSKNLSAAF